MKKFFLTALAALSLAACNKPAAGPELFSGVQVDVPQAEGQSVTLTLEFDSSWQLVSNSADWLEISPTSGFPGVAEITCTALSANEDIYERVGSFTISSGEGTASYKVVQAGKPGVELTLPRFGVAAGATAAELSVKANAELTVTSDSDWLRVSAIEQSDEDVLLPDGETVSAMKIYNVSFELEPYEEAGMRSALLSIASGDSTTEYTLNQMGSGEPELSDWNSAFLRRNLVMRFTATWCGWCPAMAHQIDLAMEERPDLIVPFNIHASDSDLYSAYSNEFGDEYKIIGYPTGIFNSYAQVDSYYGDIVKNMVLALVDEAAESLPAKTAIISQNVLDGGTLSLSVSVAVKEAGEYSLHAYLMESGIVSKQSSNTVGLGGKDYVHNAVERCPLFAPEGIDGLAFSAGAGEIYDAELDFELPSEISDPANCYVVIFVTRPVSTKFTGNVASAAYKDFGYIVDNVVELPLNGSTVVEYE